MKNVFAVWKSAENCIVYKGIHAYNAFRLIELVYFFVVFLELYFGNEALVLWYQIGMSSYFLSFILFHRSPDMCRLASWSLGSCICCKLLINSLLGCSAFQSHDDRKARKASTTTQTNYNDGRYLGKETFCSTSCGCFFQLNNECVPWNLVKVPYVNLKCRCSDNLERLKSFCSTWKGEIFVCYSFLAAFPRDY
jgi:hypothetical protein